MKLTKKELAYEAAKYMAKVIKFHEVDIDKTASTLAKGMTRDELLLLVARHSNKI